ncbi:MAG: hypothetical protein R6U35_01680 [Candidatus Humimicrobiaceae bacterium]
MNNIISSSICIDTEEIESITDLENKYAEEIKKTFKLVAEKLMKAKEEKILKEDKYKKKDQSIPLSIHQVWQDKIQKVQGSKKRKI